MTVRLHSATAIVTTAALIAIMMTSTISQIGSITAHAFRYTTTPVMGIRQLQRQPGRRASLPSLPVSHPRNSASGSGRPSSPSSSSRTTMCYEPPGAVNGGGRTTDAIGDDTVVDDVSEVSQSNEAWENHRSRWSRRKQRKKMEKQQQQGKGLLDWETFDFSTSPKTDQRFENDSTFSNQTGVPDHVMNTIPTDSLTYKSYIKSETNMDETASKQSLQSRSELLNLSPALVQKSIDILAPFVQPRRHERIDKVLEQRTRHTRFLFENPSNPSNVWACLRTLDSFGIQHVDVVVHSDSYLGKAAVNQKRGMRTAMGSAMWMTIRQFGSSEEAVRCLKEKEGCLIYASDLNPSAKDVRDLTWGVEVSNKDSVDGAVADGDIKGQRPICIVMGNEDRGISDVMRELADETFYLPMCGFAESFNLSVATAITLAYMSAVSSRGEEVVVSDGTGNGAEGKRGPLRPGDLDPHEKECLRLKGLVNSIAQKRTAKALLKKEGIQLPKSFYNE